MSDLTARAIADLREQLAATQAELEQQRTRAEAAEQELSAEKKRGNSAWDDGYAKSLERARVAERHRDDLIAQNKRECQIMAAAGVKETLLRDAIPVLAQQRDEARAKLAAIRAHLAGVDVAKLGALADQLPELAQCERAATLCEHFGDAAMARSDIAIINEAIRDAAPVLLAAAREAMANG